jgi:hypothetical protein
MMELKTVLMMVALVPAILAGCCQYPSALKTAQSATKTIQSVYDPLVSANLSDQTNNKVKLALVAADTALALSGTIQDAKCATPQQAAQLELQAQQVKEAATAARVK